MNYSKKFNKPKKKKKKKKKKIYWDNRCIKNNNENGELSSKLKHINFKILFYQR
jgi:hypothetical protein